MITEYKVNRSQIESTKTKRKTRIFLVDLYFTRCSMRGACTEQASADLLLMQFWSNLHIKILDIFPVTFMYDTPLVNDRQLQPLCLFE